MNHVIVQKGGADTVDVVLVSARCAGSRLSVRE